MISSHVFILSLVVVLFSRTIFALGLKKAYEIQIENEFLASNTYLTFAHRLSTQGVYHGFANFFFDSAHEERDHGKKLIDFYNLRNREILLYDINIDNNTIAINDLTQMIHTVVGLEQKVFDSLIDVCQAANNVKDYSTIHFIKNEMLEEQIIAVKYMKDLLKRIQRNTAYSTIILQMMDQKLRKIK